MRILAVSGSLRSSSSNTQLLQAAAMLAPQGCEVVLFEGLNDLPHFNPDLEASGTVPDAVVTVGGGGAMIGAPTEALIGLVLLPADGPKKKDTPAALVPPEVTWKTSVSPAQRSSPSALLPLMSERKPPSQNSPGFPPARTSAAMRRASASWPTSTCRRTAGRARSAAPPAATQGRRCGSLPL